MREIFGDFWQIPADARCITTNGFIKKNGHGVMGAGIAGQAQMRYPYLPQTLGSCLKEKGNHVQIMEYEDDKYRPSVAIVMFPVKHAWYEDADLDLIRRSAEELVELADQHELWLDVLVPRPGCGNGNLNWDDVKEVLEPIFDERFIIIDR